MGQLVIALALILMPLAANAVENNVPRITVEELKAKMDKGAPVIVVDVRTGPSYDNSKIRVKGDVRIPYQDIAKRTAELPFGSEIVLYCT